ncbi:MAG TPA: tyrosinase family protein, partial [Ardenticatenaceae bacterium]|nr:tyrosinase family protein [Ardenticatenaceae bacterium]
MSASDEAKLLDLRRRSERLFKRPYNNLPVLVAPELAASQVQSVVRVDTGEEVTDMNAIFNVFDVTHERTALGLAQSFAQSAAAQPDTAGLDAALDAAEAALATQNSDLVKFALSVFITNNPRGRNLYIPPAVEQSPELFIPSRPNVSPAAAALGGLGAEAALDYFREDPDFNSHHAQWHRVYPASGSVDPNDENGPPIAKDRQGELFWYMHQQMLARYDTERIALNLNPVVPFENYREMIPEGYRTEAIIANRYSGRDPDRLIANVRFNLGGGATLDVTDLEAARDQLREAARTGQFNGNGGGPIPLTPDARGATLFGASLEASVGSALTQGDVAAVGGLHNIGHGFFSALSAPRPGVMGDTAAAVRDPVFHRWHRHIDGLFAEWQEHLPPNDLGAGAPPVILRKDETGQSTDIGLALLSDLQPGIQDGTQFDGAAFGAQRFGGDNWDTPLANFVGGDGKLTRTLQSSIGRYNLVLPNGNRFPIFHLDHAEFAYFFRLENTSDSEQQVTVRVFLAATERADDRRWWIEMDKFLQTLAPTE